MNLGLGLGLGFNRGGGGSAPDIERSGLLFNIDIQDLSTLFYKAPDTSIVTPATVGQLVWKIVAKTSAGTIDLISSSINAGLKLQQDSNGKYFLEYGADCTYTKDGGAASELFKSRGRCITQTATVIGANNDINSYCLKASSPGNAFIGANTQGAGTYAIGSTSNGIGFANITSVNPQVCSIIERATNGDGIGCRNKTTQTMTEYGTRYDWIFSSLIVANATKINLYGLQVYDGTTFDNAKLIDINTKAMEYYGVTE